jgi:putative membrane protein
MISQLPFLNCTLNGICFFLLILGRIAIAKGNKTLHKKLMLSAFVVSSIFLTSYLIYHFNTEIINTYQGGYPYLYFPMLISHILLAAGMLPLIFITFKHALK